MGLIEKVRRTKKIKNEFCPEVSIAFGDNAIVINHFSKTKEIKIASLRHSFKNSLLAKTFAEKMYDKLYKFSLKRADKIVPVSNEINKELKRIFKIDNTYFVTNGYDIAEINRKADSALPGNLAAFFNDQVIAHVGRFDATKCHVELVKFFSIVKNLQPLAKLVLIGGIDYARQENREIYDFCIAYLIKKNFKIIYAGRDYTDEEILTADILIAGHQSNPFCFLSRATVFVFPSILEGFPNALMEAMVCGLPVISSDCPTGPKEILRDDLNDESFGILLPVFDHEYILQDESTGENHTVWAQTIIALLQDKKRQEELKLQSYKRSSQYSLELVCKKWLGILNSL
jgi:glycosyltransferase involved in cell wall biosynthesis